MSFLKELQHIRYRRSIFTVHEYFLTEHVKPDADINYCIQCFENTNNALSEFYTLLIDLSQPLETIRAGVYHRSLTEINSFLNNQEFDYKLAYNLPEQELNTFIKLFNQFAVGKKIRKAETFRLKAYNKHSILGVSCLKQKGKIICVNFYRVTKERAANISSFIVNDAPGNNSQLGRAHRALHWLDIIEFKEAGARYYDFCGWYEGSSDKNLLNINAFKEQFTKNKVKEYNGVIYKNRLLIFLLKILK